MSLALRLKEATWASHQSVESRAWQRALARGEADPERLACYLAQLRRLHAALEAAADADPELSAALGFDDAMRHSRRLDMDLAALGGGAGIAALPATLKLLLVVESAIAAEPAALLGLLYVLEGSMNGNRFLVRALRRGPNASHCDFAYFDPYGDAQPVRWTAFKAALDCVTLGPEEESAVIAAALAAFDGITGISDEVLTEPSSQQRLPAFP